jgi:single-strand DNA-binding protein
MSNINRVLLSGNISRDAQVRQYQSKDGTPRLAVRFGLAVGRRGGRDAGADFINCTYFLRADSHFANYIRKGVPVSIEGRLQSGKYQNQNGETIYTTDVVVDNMDLGSFDTFTRLYGGLPNGQRPAPATPPQQPQQPQQQYAPAGYQQAPPQQAPQQPQQQYAPAGYQQAPPQQAPQQPQRATEDSFEAIDEDVPF